MSGVVVPTTMKSMSAGVSPARSIAFRAASVARSDVATPGSTMWRCLMPVRCWIHSSLVSTIFSRSALVSSRGGHVDGQAGDARARNRSGSGCHHRRGSFRGGVSPKYS